MNTLFKSGSTVKGIWKVYTTDAVDGDVLTEFLFYYKLDAVKLYAYMCMCAHIEDVGGEVHIKEVYVYTVPKFAFNLEINQTVSPD